MVAESPVNHIENRQHQEDQQEINDQQDNDPLDVQDPLLLGSHEQCKEDHIQYQQHAEKNDRFAVADNKLPEP